VHEPLEIVDYEVQPVKIVDYRVKQLRNEKPSHWLKSYGPIIGF